jgi:DNA-binding transcriptional MerR regulator
MASRWLPNSRVSGPQTLRLYEQRGLLSPSRTAGGTRRYSDADLERLGQISDLAAQGINLAGIAHILDLQAQNSELKSDYTRLELLNTELKAAGRAEKSPAHQVSEASNKAGRGRRDGRRNQRRNGPTG